MKNVYVVVIEKDAISVYENKDPTKTKPVITRFDISGANRVA